MSTKKPRARKGSGLIGYTPEGWRDAGNYSPRQSTPMRRWAAEFLLRNAEFQAALAELRALWHGKGDWRPPYRRRAREVVERFGLGHWAYIQFREGEPLIYPSFKVAPLWLDEVSVMPEWGTALVFDLRKPIAPQVRVAEQLLRSTGRLGVQRRRALRDRGADYAGMLRALDALALKVSYAEIGRVVFPRAADPTDTAKKASRAGARLRDGGYLELPFLDADKRAATLRRGIVSASS